VDSGLNLRSGQTTTDEILVKIRWPKLGMGGLVNDTTKLALIGITAVVLGKIGPDLQAWTSWDTLHTPAAVGRLCEIISGALLGWQGGRIATERTMVKAAELRAAQGHQPTGREGQ